MRRNGGRPRHGLIFFLFCFLQGRRSLCPGLIYTSPFGLNLTPMTATTTAFDYAHAPRNTLNQAVCLTAMTIAARHVTKNKSADCLSLRARFRFALRHSTNDDTPRGGFVLVNLDIILACYSGNCSHRVG